MQKKEFEDLFRKHYLRMINLARHMLNDEEEAKDVVSDVLTKVWHGSIHINENRQEAMLLTCIHHSCINLLNRRSIKTKVHQLITLENSPPVSVPTIDSPSYLDRIRLIIDNKLSSKDRLVVTMKYERKMKYREMAKELGISEAAVYKHLVHAMKIIKDELRNGDE